MANNLMIIPHAITFILCSVVVIFASRNIISLYKAQHLNHVMTITLSLLCLFQIAAILSFVFNQAIWVAEQHGTVIGVTSSMGWLAYDYSNTLFHLTVGVTINYYLTAYDLSSNRKDRRKRI